MLVTLKEILNIADERGIAIGSFNTPNMTSARAIISAAEELNQPVIIMHAQIHEEMGLCRMDEMAPVMLMFAKRANSIFPETYMLSLSSTYIPYICKLY